MLGFIEKEQANRIKISKPPRHSMVEMKVVSNIVVMMIYSA